MQDFLIVDFENTHDLTRYIFLVIIGFFLMMPSGVPSRKQ